MEHFAGEAPPPVLEPSYDVTGLQDWQLKFKPESAGKGRTTFLLDVSFSFKYILSNKKECMLQSCERLRHVNQVLGTILSFWEIVDQNSAVSS